MRLFSRCYGGVIVAEGVKGFDRWKTKLELRIVVVVELKG